MGTHRVGGRWHEERRMGGGFGVYAVSWTGVPVQVQLTVPRVVPKETSPSQSQLCSNYVSCQSRTGPAPGRKSR